VTQPTVGRRIDSFEQRLGARLFLRTPSGYSLSAAGQSILASVERMDQEALAAERIAAGRDLGVQGIIRITSPVWLMNRVLAPMLVAFTTRHLGITLELVAEARWLSLVRHEADIALRMAQFEHQDIIQRELTRIPFGLYASEGYLKERGSPDFTRGCEGHLLVATNDLLHRMADVSWLESVATKARVAVRSNGHEVLASAAAAGGGLVCLPRYLGDSTDGLRWVDATVQPPERKLWLGVHRDTLSAPRVKALVDFLVHSIGGLQLALGSPAPGAKSRFIAARPRADEDPAADQASRDDGTKTGSLPQTGHRARRSQNGQ
jgi:DNA-binding transcriptional LysR family regulator